MILFDVERMQLRQIPILFILVSGLGCDALFYDFTQVDPPNDTRDVGLDLSSDMADSADMGDLVDKRPDLSDMRPDLSDMGPDLVDMGPDLIDMGSDLGDSGFPENVCVVGGEFFGQCDAVGQNCPLTDICQFVYIPSVDRLETRCVTDSNIYILPVGSVCNQDPMMRCRPELNCFQDNVCRRSCDRRDGRGCEQGEFCQTFLPEMSTGLCVNSCN